MEKNKILIALGGNAIKQSDEDGTFEKQMENSMAACKQISKIIENGYKIAITHGNGPQVGDLAIQQLRAADEATPLPLKVLVAMTQGQIGHMISTCLKNDLKNKESIITLVTHVKVDINDPDFEKKSKPIGPYYFKKDIKKLQQEYEWDFRKVRDHKKPYRRVVPSPKPLYIQEANVIKKLVEDGNIVIASGGGGIPVYLNKNNEIESLDAVIDKDASGELLARLIDADLFLILTDVEYAFINFGKKDQKPLKILQVNEAEKYLKEGHFGQGSMEPKVKSAIKFVKKTNKKAIITSLEKGFAAIEGKIGTRIIPNNN